MAEDVVSGILKVKVGNIWQAIRTVVGPKGDKGADGATGPIGPTGPKGERGETGPTPNLSNYVTKDGDETITGEKTFTGGVCIADKSDSSINVAVSLGQSEYYEEPYHTLRQVYSGIDDVVTEMYKYDEEGNAICGHTNYQYPKGPWYLEGHTPNGTFALAHMQMEEDYWRLYLGGRSGYWEDEETGERIEAEYWVDISPYGITLQNYESNYYRQYSEYWPGNVHITDDDFHAYLGSFQASEDIGGAINAWPTPDEYGIGASEWSYFKGYWDEETGEYVEYPEDMMPMVNNAWAFKATKYGLYYGQEYLDGDSNNCSRMQIGCGQTLISNNSDSAPMIDISVCEDTSFMAVPGDIAMKVEYGSEGDDTHTNAQVNASWDGVYIKADCVEDGRDVGSVDVITRHENHFIGDGLFDGEYKVQLGVSSMFRVTNSHAREEGESNYLDAIFSDFGDCNITTGNSFSINSCCGDKWDEELGGFADFYCTSLTMDPCEFHLYTNNFSTDAYENDGVYIYSDYFISLSTSSEADLIIGPYSEISLLSSYYFYPECLCYTGDFELGTNVIEAYDPEYGWVNYKPTGSRLSLSQDKNSASLIVSDYEWTDPYETEYTESGYAFDVKYDGTYCFRDIADEESAVTFTLDDFRILKQIESAEPFYTFDNCEVQDGVVVVNSHTRSELISDGTEFEVTVGGGLGLRDCILSVKCGSTAPKITWGTHFHPRTSAVDFACVAGVRNVYWIAEYDPGEFVVAGWQETEGGGTHQKEVRHDSE